MLFLNADAIPFFLLILGIVLLILVIRAMFRFLRWLICGVFGLSQGQQKKRRKSGYWLNDAMDKQEIRFQNSAPPTRGEAKVHKQTFQERWNESRGLSPTGWKFNEETGLWESPEQQKMKK